MEQDRESYTDDQDRESYEVQYVLCEHCDHFVTPNPSHETNVECAPFVHLDDGEKEHDHEAEPSGEGRPLHEWKEVRPDLFIEHEDGKVGPNSAHHTTLL